MIGQNICPVYVLLVGWNIFPVWLFTIGWLIFVLFDPQLLVSWNICPVRLSTIGWFYWTLYSLFCFTVFYHFFNQLHFSQFDRFNEELWWKIKSANWVQILSETVSHCTRHESILPTSYLLNGIADRAPLPSSTVMEKAIENHFSIFPKKQSWQGRVYRY